MMLQEDGNDDLTFQSKARTMCPNNQTFYSNNFSLYYGILN